MSKRVCPTPGCPNLTDGGKCKPCAKQAERARGTSTQRGYGYAHQQDRERWRPAVEAMKVRCRRCKEIIVPDYSLPGDDWDMGHNQARDQTHPEHARACNRRTATHKRDTKGGG